MILKNKIKPWVKFTLSCFMLSSALTHTTSAYSNDKIHKDIVDCKQIEKTIKSLPLEQEEGVPILKAIPYLEIYDRYPKACLSFTFDHMKIRDGCGGDTSKVSLAIDNNILINLCNMDTTEMRLMTCLQDIVNIKKLTSVVTLDENKQNSMDRYRYTTSVSMSTASTINRSDDRLNKTTPSYLLAKDFMLKTSELGKNKALTGCVELRKNNKTLSYYLYDIDVDYVKLNYNGDNCGIAYPIVRLSSTYDTVIYYLYDNINKKVICKAQSNIHDLLTHKNTNIDKNKEFDKTGEVALSIFAVCIGAILFICVMKSLQYS